MILFDVDGVLLSEERYFDASALTVWELLHSNNYIGLDPDNFTPGPDEDVIRRVRGDVFDQDQVLKLIKARGINANWDMVYLAFSYQIICILDQLKSEHPEKVKTIIQAEINRDTLHEIKTLASKNSVRLDYAGFVADFEKGDARKQQLFLYLNTIAEEKIGVATKSFTRNSQLWDVCREVFQEWYVGDDKAELSNGKPPFQTGKKGFLANEIPIVPPEEIKTLFKKLSDKGITIGIGTGRPEIETLEPLRAMDVLEHVDHNRIVSASDVLKAEQKYPDKAPLAKPQPFTYVYGWLGKQADPEEAINHRLPLADADDILVVGDSIADFMAARSIGCRFAAVLTGLSGQDARGEFEKLEADYILNDVREVIDIF
ncbi:HAD family hydrolase [Pseudalkalibacillus decolorationis]|uniref:HAD family hydrolase n=1 Tax=Pseudalkalibacillus decolorationis TaxID=163879 RepID=UPI002147B3D6|nr:HAD hydrolase-like protein [Pseudalkalibacillus decolorationis]